MNFVMEEGEEGKKGTHQLLVMREEDLLITLALSEGDATVIGRSAAAQVMINDPRMSRMHAMFWIEQGLAWVRDLGSTNGTLVDGKRIRDPIRISGSSCLQIGDATIIVRPRAPTTCRAPMWIEDVDSGLRQRVADAPIALIDVVVRPEEEALWLEDASGRRRLKVGDTFTAGGREHRLVDTEVSHTTDHTRSLGPPYALDDRSERCIVVRDLNDDREHAVTSLRRARLMRLLAGRLHEDRLRRMPSTQQGWTADDEIGMAVWGDDWSGSASNRLNVLIHRIRRELEQSGFVADCLQKQRGATRLWLEEVLPSR
ncbi:MAG: pSer/pThr/pTyr-binding forkhead associated (FHA) protein [Myxococcota bacterium]|jgi:pSer/pThr/pTyr-binding forkhead associated (FHA) protein